MIDRIEIVPIWILLVVYCSFGMAAYFKARRLERVLRKLLAALDRGSQVDPLSAKLRAVRKELRGE